MQGNEAPSIQRDEFTQADQGTLARILHLRDAFPPLLRPKVIFCSDGHVTLDWNRRQCSLLWILESFLTPSEAAKRLDTELAAQAPRQATAARFAQVGRVNEARALEIITTCGGDSATSLHLGQYTEKVSIPSLSIQREPFTFSV